MSPFSIETCLSLLYCGSEGKTAVLMAEKLTFINGAANAVGRAFHKLLKPWHNSKALQMANNIFIAKSYQIQPIYKIIAEKQFYSRVRSMDFHKTAQATSYINDWVADETNDMITSLIKPGVVTADTPMVLVNAIHFENKWATQFNPRFTTDHPFHLSGQCGSNKGAPMIPMMNNKVF